MLADLIPELLDLILDLLGIPDFYSLRLTCRRLERASRAAFGAAAFSKPRLDLSGPNLSWLSEIASHSSFRLDVREWHIGHWGGRGSAWKFRRRVPFGEDGRWPRLESGSLDPSSELVTRVAHLLSRFPNCTGATITDEREPRTYLSYSAAGESLEERDFYPGDAVELVLRAFSAPGAPALRHFRTRMARNVEGFSPGAISGATVSSVRANWSAHLRELVLQYVACHDSNLTRILELLASAPKLRTLRLMWVVSRAWQPPLFGLSRHLESLPDFPPPLEVLGLGGISISEADMLRLLSACKDTLRTLDLYLSELRPGSWTNVLGYLHTTPFPRLRRLSMFNCTDGIDGDTMDFCALWVNRELQASCGGTFEFGMDRMRWTFLRSHITGFLFEAGQGQSGMKPALRACMEESRRCPSGPEAHAPCVEVDGLGEVPGVSPPKSPDEPAPVYERWTGLPMTMRYVEPRSEYMDENDAWLVSYWWRLRLETRDLGDCATKLRAVCKLLRARTALLGVIMTSSEWPTCPDPLVVFSPLLRG